MTLSSQFNNEEIVYDYIFSGLGASNSLIILSLLKDNLLQNKRIAIIEPSLKIINDKTYCFWAHPNDQIVIDLKPIINRYYNNVVINGGQKQNISDQPYYLIRSIDLYNYVREKLLKANIPIFNYSTNELTVNNDIYTIKTSHGNLFTYHLFDSAPPQNETPHSNIIHLHQSFYGVIIKCDHDLFQENTFEMMNFDVDQNNFTQFIYTLPYSSNEALIELTRFGAEKIDIDYAKEIINEALQNKVGKFEIIDEEIGCIPMTTHLHQPAIYSGVLKTGTNANLIKPSTGYGFKNMFHFAEMVKNEINNANNKDLNTLSLKVKKRFRFYDTLLLIILLYWPKEGKRIFTKLFLAQNVKTIFLFLDEQTSIMQEVKIFKSLPLVPFLKSLLVYVVKYNFLRYLITALILVIYFNIKQYNPTIATYYSYLCIALGLFWVGIPHGALDHLTISKNKKSRSTFIVKYVITIIVYYFFWQFSPSISLLIFIIYSSFHFGESELQEINITTTTVSTYLKTLVLGASILMFIILTHIYESIEIVTNIKGLEFIKLYEDILVKCAIPTAILAFFYLLFSAISTNKSSIYALITLLIVGVFTNLLIAFSIYFICQHSLNAWSHLQRQLKIHSYGLYKKALPHTLGAFVILITCIWLNINESNQVKTILPSFFIFLACISLPHFVLMHLFYKQE